MEGVFFCPKVQNLSAFGKKFVIIPEMPQLAPHLLDKKRNLYYLILCIAL